MHSTRVDSGIYKITCVPTGKFYIGSAVSFKHRCTKHRNDSNRNEHPNKHLQNAWNKYGQDAFKFEVLLICAKEDLIMYEQRALDGMKPEFNVCRTAGNTLGVKRSDAAKAAISAKNKGHRRNVGRKVPDETKVKNRLATLAQIAKHGHPMTGRRHSEATKIKLSESKKGNTYKRGYAATEETRAKISASAMGNKNCVGRVVSDETKAKISAKNKGRKQTAEHIEKAHLTCRKPVMIGDVRYESIGAAAAATGRNHRTVRGWLVAGHVHDGNGKFSSMASRRLTPTVGQSAP